jgi:hypothetical protein
MYEGVTRIETRWQKVEAESPSYRRKKRDHKPDQPSASSSSKSSRSSEESEDQNRHIDITI